VFGEWVPDAIVFDCDGLLVDTEPCWTLAEAELFARRGLVFGDAEKASLIGTSVPAACATLADAFADGATAAQIESELLMRVAVIVARDAGAMPGAVALVNRVVARRPTAVASNSPRSRPAPASVSTPDAVSRWRTRRPGSPPPPRQACGRSGCRRSPAATSAPS
jgi:beta-phosphoglucomutase-like phosphatase (HAD superfamily)